MKTSPCYLYAIGESAGRMDDRLTGVDAAPVYAVPRGSIVAWVSDLVRQRIRPELQHLTAHHAVVRQLMERGTVLPVAFGTVAGSRDAVTAILQKNSTAFITQLDRVRGKVEMGLRVSWDVSNIFDHFVRQHPSLADLRDSLQGQPGGASARDRIELGRCFSRLLAQDRQRCAHALMQALQPYCVALRERPPREEREVTHLACLVERQGCGSFEERVTSAARLFDDSYAFALNGPWAPHHFVQMALE